MNQMLENKKRGSWSTYYFIMIKKHLKGVVVYPDEVSLILKPLLFEDVALVRDRLSGIVAPVRNRLSGTVAPVWNRLSGTCSTAVGPSIWNCCTGVGPSI